jgi:addiction module HigA family antidote
MARLGHSSPRAAMIYQHATRERDKVIANELGHLVNLLPVVRCGAGRCRDRRLPLRGGGVETKTVMPPVHPGEILLEEFLKPLEVSQYQLAKEISVPARRINEIVHGQRRISADTALRLARYFGTSERFWMNLQTRYDLEIEKDRLGEALDEIHPLSAVS